MARHRAPDDKYELYVRRSGKARVPPPGAALEQRVGAEERKPEEENRADLGDDVPGGVSLLRCRRLERGRAERRDQPSDDDANREALVRSDPPVGFDAFELEHLGHRSVLPSRVHARSPILVAPDPELKPG